MFDNILYIIGNGFDLHHDVASSYKCFRDWLKKNNPELYEVYSAICEYDALWSDFENSLAYVNRDYFINFAELFLPDYSKDPNDWQAADILLAGDWARDKAYELISDLKSAFFKWIKSLKAPESYYRKKLYLDYDARFLTFNYTDFLESQYGITSSNILYLHGNRRFGKGSIVVGHGDDDNAFDEWWNAKQYDKPRFTKKGKRYFKRDHAWKTYRSQLPEYENIAEGIQAYYEESRKPVERILRDNDAYFQDLYDVKTIYAFGFSFNPIDMPYIRRIIECNDDPGNIRWYISYYSDNEKSKLKSTLSDLGIDIENNVQFHPLNHWQMKSSS